MVVTMHLLVEDNMALPALEVVYYVYPVHSDTLRAYVARPSL